MFGKSKQITELRQEVSILNQVIKCLEFEIKNPKPHKEGDLIDGWVVDYVRLCLNEWVWVVALTNEKNEHKSFRALNHE